MALSISTEQGTTRADSYVGEFVLDREEVLRNQAQSFETNYLFQEGDSRWDKLGKVALWIITLFIAPLFSYKNSKLAQEALKNFEMSTVVKNSEEFFIEFQLFEGKDTRSDNLSIPFISKDNIENVLLDIWRGEKVNCSKSYKAELKEFTNQGSVYIIKTCFTELKVKGTKVVQGDSVEEMVTVIDIENKRVVMKYGSVRPKESYPGLE